MNRGARRMRRAAGRPRPGTLVDRNQLKGNVFHGFEIPPPTAKAARVFCAVRSLFLGLPRTLVSGPPPPGIEKRQTGLPVDLHSAGSRRIGGYAAVLGVKSEPLGGSSNRLIGGHLTNQRQVVALECLRTPMTIY